MQEMETMHERSPRTNDNREIFTAPSLLLALALMVLPFKSTAAGFGAASAGGGRTTGGVYVNQATLGQISGPPARGGVYQLASGFQSRNARASEPPLGTDSPRISIIPDQVIHEDSEAIQVPFRIGDPDTPPSQLTLTRTTSNPGLVRLADITFGGAGTNRVVRLAPRPDQSGSAIITITVTDPQNHSTSGSFLVEVLPVNDPPVISPLADLTIESGKQQTVEFNVNDSDDDPASLNVVPLSDNPTLIPPGGLALTGQGSRRQLVVTPVSGQTGEARVGLQVIDPLGGMASVSFRVTVTPAPVRTPPRITGIITLPGGRFRLRVMADAGAMLRLESSPSLGAHAVWRPEGATAIGNGAEIGLESDPSITAARFYRVRAD